jgi:hypothetical protein
MRRAAYILAFCLLFCLPAFAQERDTTYYSQPVNNYGYAGIDIISLLERGTNATGTIKLQQSQSIVSAFRSQVASNSSRRITGYRVRIFFDNKQNARDMSSSVAGGFESRYPGIHAYRTYENPYFKVSVGDFRTKDDALRFMNSIKEDYPTVFLVKETIGYPLFF